MSLPNSDELVAEQFARVPEQQSLVGTFVSQSGAVAQVVQGDSLLAVKSSAQGLIPGDSVRLERRGGDLILLGPVRDRATTGRVTVTSPLTVEYPNGSGVTATLTKNSSYSPVVNDVVLIDWSSGGSVVCKLDAVPTTTTPDTPATAAPKTFDVTFTALDSGAYQSGYGWRTNDVWSSASNLGAWFYGSKIRDTIPDAATILTARIFLPLSQQLGAAPFGRHASATRPGGAVSFSATSTLSSLTGWVSIPTTLIDHLKSNTGGLGFDYGGYNIWRGTQKDGLSGAVRVTYKA